jgi:hypothetical protein
MRIAIISHYRSGSTMFSRWLSLELGYYLIIEPYNTDKSWNKNREYNIEQSLQLENVVVKYLYNQFNTPMEIESVLNSFDKIILLIRQNDKESAISAVYADENKKFHNTYFIDDMWIDNHIGLIENEIINLTMLKDKIKNISNGLLVTYENIFEEKIDIDKIKNYIGLDMFKHNHMHVLDKKYRYKNNKSKELI